MRYQIELILGVPFVAGFLAYYLHLGFIDNSAVQYPEQLYRYKLFMAYTVACFWVLLILLFLDIPLIEKMFSQTRVVFSDSL